MITRQALLLLALLTTLTPAGCQRAGTTTPTPSAAAVPAPTPAPAVNAPVLPDPPDRNDYRTLSRGDLEALIRTKIGVETVTLVPGGLNHYSGQISSPDGTMLPLEVTVEAERIICDTKHAAGALRQTITPRGVDPGQPIIK